MTDPTRKPRILRFRFSRALIVSAPLMGGLACGEPAPAVNTVAPEPEVVETTNVGGRGESDEQPEAHEERPDENTNVVESPPEPERPAENTNVTEEEALR